MNPTMALEYSSKLPEICSLVIANFYLKIMKYARSYEPISVGHGHKVRRPGEMVRELHARRIGAALARLSAAKTPSQKHRRHGSVASTRKSRRARIASAGSQGESRVAVEFVSPGRRAGSILAPCPISYGLGVPSCPHTHGRPYTRGGVCRRRGAR